MKTIHYYDRKDTTLIKMVEYVYQVSKIDLLQDTVIVVFFVGGVRQRPWSKRARAS